MKPANVLLLMSDEHSKRVLGCYGNDLIQTPALDALAARGTRFTSAYTPCPICVPARGSIQTGRYVHQIRSWSNGEPYRGRAHAESWGHRLRDEGHRVVSVGKLHLRRTEDDNGFDTEIIPMHIVDGVGDIHGCVRTPPRKRPTVSLLADQAGYGESHYTRYDEDITRHACDWLRTDGSETDRPWVLMVSWVRPHFPMIAPERFRERYPINRMPLPFATGAGERPDHPALQALRGIQCYDDYFESDDHRRLALSAYYGMVNGVDDQVGQVLEALDACGLTESTRVIYSSDHGDNLGNRGFWGKSTMYEDSAGVPLIVAGPDLPEGKVEDAPVSLVDLHQTIIEGAGHALTEEEQTDLPGHSLFRVANGDCPERTVLSEYHASASDTGVFMIRHGKWKYVHYVGYLPQLFDLEADPLELRDLGTDPAHAAVVAECEARLRSVCDPDAVNAQAFADQKALIDSHGGVEAVLTQGQFPHTPAPGEKITIG